VWIGRLLGLLAGEQFVDGGAQVGEAVLEFLEFLGHRTVMAVGMVVATRTG
jgi:hypothetical protein